MFVFIIGIAVRGGNVADLYFPDSVPACALFFFFVNFELFLAIDGVHFTGDEIFLGRVQIDFEGSRFDAIIGFPEIYSLTRIMFFQKRKQFPAEKGNVAFVNVERRSGQFGQAG